MDQKLWLANWHIEQEHNLRRDRVRSWLSDDFLKSLQHQFACSRPIIIAKISELEVWRCSYSGWKFIWSRLDRSSFSCPNAVLGLATQPLQPCKFGSSRWRRTSGGGRWICSPRRVRRCCLFLSCVIMRWIVFYNRRRS
nr:uncharacterized protein LOC4348116 isoform X2 [Oryza sativa Japonica Group]